MSDLTKRLRASVKMDAHNGDTMERSICGKQMLEAANLINALERDNSTLNAELTETIMAVADLMDENADLRREFTEAYEQCIEAIREKAARPTKPDLYDSDGASTELDNAYDEGVINSMDAIRSLIPKEESDE